jgi:hypothetical protein
VSLDNNSTIPNAVAVAVVMKNDFMLYNKNLPYMALMTLTDRIKTVAFPGMFKLETKVNQWQSIEFYFYCKARALNLATTKEISNMMV